MCEVVRVGHSPNSGGISRVHCTLRLRGNVVEVCREWQRKLRPTRPRTRLDANTQCAIARTTLGGGGSESGLGRQQSPRRPCSHSQPQRLKSTALYGDMRLRMGAGAAARNKKHAWRRRGARWGAEAAAPHSRSPAQPQPRAAERWPWVAILVRARLPPRLARRHDSGRTQGRAAVASWAGHGEHC